MVRRALTVPAAVSVAPLQHPHDRMDPTLRIAAVLHAGRLSRRFQRRRGRGRKLFFGKRTKTSTNKRENDKTARNAINEPRKTALSSDSGRVGRRAATDACPSGCVHARRTPVGQLDGPPPAGTTDTRRSDGAVPSTGGAIKRRPVARTATGARRITIIIVEVYNLYICIYYKPSRIFFCVQFSEVVDTVIVQLGKKQVVTVAAISAGEKKKSERDKIT